MSFSIGATNTRIAGLIQEIEVSQYRGHSRLATARLTLRAPFASLQDTYSEAKQGICSPVTLIKATGLFGAGKEEARARLHETIVHIILALRTLVRTATFLLAFPVLPVMPHLVSKIAFIAQPANLGEEHPSSLQDDPAPQHDASANTSKNNTPAANKTLSNKSFKTHLAAAATGLVLLSGLLWVAYSRETNPHSSSSNQTDANSNSSATQKNSSSTSSSSKSLEENSIDNNANQLPSKSYSIGFDLYNRILSLFTSSHQTEAHYQGCIAVDFVGASQTLSTSSPQEHNSSSTDSLSNSSSSQNQQNIMTGLGDPSTTESDSPSSSTTSGSGPGANIGNGEPHNGHTSAAGNTIPSQASSQPGSTNGKTNKNNPSTTQQPVRRRKQNKTLQNPTEEHTDSNILKPVVTPFTPGFR